MSEMNAQRRKVVVLAASVACISAAGPVLLKSQPRFTFVWIGFVIIALVFTLVEFVKLKRQQQ